MSRFRRRSATGLIAFLLIPASGVAPAAAADGPQYERVLNGTFDNGSKSPWWSSGNTPTAVDAGRLCAEIPGGTVNVWDSMIGQDDVPVESGQPYTLRFDASASRASNFRAVVQTASTPRATVLNQGRRGHHTPQTFVFTETSPTTSEHTQVTFQAGGGAEPYTLCLDNISFVGGVVPPGGVRDFGSPVRVNQLGYLQSGPKRATYVTDETAPQPWRLLNASGGVATSGRTSPFGTDAMSGTKVQRIDFGTYRGAGEGYRLAVGDQLSEPFAIGNNIYNSLRQDTLAYFYHNRSGIPIEPEYAGPERARAAGHLGVAPNQGDTSVPCFPGTCTTASTYGVAGTTRATTASTSSTARWPRGSCSICTSSPATDEQALRMQFRSRQQDSRRSRRGEVGARLPPAYAGPFRHGPSQDPRREVDRSAARSPPTTRSRATSIPRQRPPL